MSRLKQQWKSLSTEAKVGGILMPLVLAVFAGLVVPMLKDALSSKTTPERRASVKVMDLETAVPLSDFVAAHGGVPVPPTGMVLAAAAVDPEGVPESVDDGGASEPRLDDNAGKDDSDTGGDNVGGDEGDSGGDKADDDDNGEDNIGDDSDADSHGDESGDNENDTPGDDPNDAEERDDNSGNDENNDSDLNTNASDPHGDDDHDGVRNGDDICPKTPGNPTTGCVVAQLRIEPFGCSEGQMIQTLEPGEDDTERCDDLAVVVGDSTGSKPGDVEARAKAVAVALQETRSTRARGHGGRLEPLGVVVSVEATVTGFVGQHVSVTWSLRHANGRSLPHRWLKNRPVMTLTGKAQSDTGGTDFWVPLPKRPHGPFVVRLTMKDDEGTPLTFAKTKRFD